MPTKESKSSVSSGVKEYKWTFICSCAYRYSSTTLPPMRIRVSLRLGFGLVAVMYTNSFALQGQRRGRSGNNAFHPVVIPSRESTSITALNTKPFRRKAEQIPDIRGREQSKLEYLEQATERITESKEPLREGQWHEVISLINAWTRFQKQTSQAPIRMESLLKVLVEQRQSNPAIEITMNLYNRVLAAWACAALFRTLEVPKMASQRAREILVTLQENFERDSRSPQPDTESFRIVLHVVCRTEDTTTARRLLAFMEFLRKSQRNVLAQPTRRQYICILEMYVENEGGVLAEAFLRHMKHVSNILPDTFCYNIAMKAYTRGSNQKHSQRGREAAEHADRLLEEMKADTSGNCKPDVVTYATAISAWAASGMRAHAVSRAEELLREIEESEDIQVNTVVLNAVMSSWVKSRNPAAAKRTEEILRQMELSPIVQPDLISYNSHLHALSFSSSPTRPHFAKRAEEILMQLEKGFANKTYSFAPNIFSYNLALETICRAQESSAQIRTARWLKKMVKSEHVDPDSFSFNQVLSALANSNQEGAADTALQLLRYMDEAYKGGVHRYAPPTHRSFLAVLSAYAGTGGREAADQAQSLLDEMKTRYKNGEYRLKPTSACYNYVMDCWAKSGEGTLGARKAESLLAEMIESFDAGEKAVSPNIVTFNSVLNAWAQSGTRCCGHQAEKFLERMWERYNAGDLGVKPNVFSYNTVINAISKSKNEAKAQKALRLLRRMDKLYQAGNKEARPNAVTYTAVINSCAFPSARDQRTRRKALDTAMFTLKELQSSRYGQPNQVTYGTFIQACANLLHDDDALRHKIITRAFEQCCRDGQVGEMVLNLVLKEELLAGYGLAGSGGGSRVSLNDLPESWRCNIRQQDEWRPKSARRKQQTRTRNPNLKP